MKVRLETNKICLNHACPTTDLMNKSVPKTQQCKRHLHDMMVRHYNTCLMPVPMERSLEFILHGVGNKRCSPNQEAKADNIRCTNPHMFLLNVEEIGPFASWPQVGNQTLSRSEFHVFLQIPHNQIQFRPMQVALVGLYFLKWLFLQQNWKTSSFNSKKNTGNTMGTPWVHPRNIRHDQCLDLGVSAFFGAIFWVTEVYDVL